VIAVPQPSKEIKMGAKEIREKRSVSRNGKVVEHVKNMVLADVLRFKLPKMTPANKVRLRFVRPLLLH
jgi:hypothetical protein